MRHSDLLAGLIILSMLAACRPPVASDATAATGPAPLDADTATSTPVSTPTLLPTPVVQPGLWPLAADLFYLTRQGQIWHQPLAGDTRAAAPVTPSEMTVVDFSVAPGGNWLIYRTPETVAIRSLDGSQERTISRSAGAPESLPAPGTHSVAWSPDASKIAYTTERGFEVLIPDGGGQGEPLLYPITESALASISWSHDSYWLLATRMDGSAVIYSIDPLRKWAEIGHLNDHFWLADGRLAFAPAEGGLALLTPGDASSRIFLIPQDRQITHLMQRPDQMLAFFSHSASVTEPGFLHLANTDDLSFRVASNVAISTSGLIWDPAGERLIGPGREPNALMLTDPLSGYQSGFEASSAVLALDWGDAPPAGVAGLETGIDLYFLAPQAGIVQVWRLPGNGELPHTVTIAAADVTSYDVSPDGSQIVYASEGVLWRMVANTRDIAPLATFNTPGSAGTPAFSPTGREIAYADGGIRIINLDTAETRQLTSDQRPRSADDPLVQIADLPRWSPDGQWLLVRITFSEGSDQALLPVDGGPTIPLNLYGAAGRWLRTGTAALYSAGGKYGEPFVATIQAGEPPEYAHLGTLPVIDAVLRPDGRLAVLRIPLPGAGGPTVVRAYSMQIAGTDLRAESKSFVLEQAVFAPGAQYIAGLVQPHVDEQGQMSGWLAIADLANDTIYTIQSVSGAHDLKWGY
jgi:Tol biopolymer transport system component